MPIPDAFYFSARSCHQQLKRGLLSIALTALSGGYGLAASVAQLSGLDYQDGLLTITAHGKASAPTVEVWPGNAGPKPTELVILKFPTAEGNAAMLQQIGNRLLLAHPELKKCLIGPLSHEPKGPSGIQIALEIELSVAPSGDAIAPKTVVSGNAKDAQILIALLPGAAVTQTTLAAIEAPPTDKTAALPNKAQALALLEANRRQAELEQEVSRLRQSLDGSREREDALKRQLAQYEGYIKDYAPDVDENASQSEAVIQNLKNALTKLATRLKATEVALAEGKAGNRQAAPASSRTSSALPVPVTNLMMSVAEPVVNRPGVQRVYQSAPSTVQPAQVQSQPEKQPFVASASNSTAVAKGVPTRENELTLEAAIRENPRKYPAYLELADLYAERAALSDAENILTLLLRQNPAYSMGYYKLALVYARQQRPAEAQSALNSYRKLKPDDTAGVKNLQQALQTSPLPLQASRPQTSSSEALPLPQFPPPIVSTDAIGPPNPKH